MRSAALLAAGPAEGLVADSGFGEVHALGQRIGFLSQHLLTGSL